MADSTVYKHTENFESLYANNVRFERSVWDLKLIFGQLDQNPTPPEVEQHTGVTIPWAQVKITAYYLLFNLILHQAQFGNVSVPAPVLPAPPDPSAPELDDRGKNALEYVKWVHEQIFGLGPFIPPGVNPEWLG